MKSLVMATLAVGLLTTSNVTAQTQLFEYEGFTVNAKVQKLEEQKKKDKHLMQIRMLSEEQDLYYPANMAIDSKTKKKRLSSKRFGSVKVQNATGLFKSQSIEGEASQFKTEDGTVLCVFKKDKIYNENDKFKVKSGVEPVLTYEERKTLKPLSEYNLLIDGQMLEGLWKSDCIDGEILITYIDTGVKDVLILRNGTKSHSWVRRGAQVFDKTNMTASLTYDKQTSELIYFNNDGIQCRWKRESKQ